MVRVYKNEPLVRNNKCAAAYSSKSAIFKDGSLHCGS